MSVDFYLSRKEAGDCVVDMKTLSLRRFYRNAAISPLSLSPSLSPWLASVALTQIAYSMKYNSISCPPVWPEGVIDARKPVRHAVGNVAKIQHPHLRRFLQLRNYSPV